MIRRFRGDRGRERAIENVPTDERGVRGRGFDGRWARKVDASNATPTTRVTTLANGATIASEDAFGRRRRWGCTRTSGATERAWERGFTHALERAAFKATRNRSSFRVTRECEVMGANLSASASREQFCFAADALKTRLPETTELLLDSALNPALENHEVEEVVKNLKEEVKELHENPQALLMEATHATAYEGGLGHALVAPNGDLSHITGDSLREFVKENFTAPRIVLSAAGCDHDELVRIAEPMLATLPNAPGAEATLTTYVGATSDKRRILRSRPSCSVSNSRVVGAIPRRRPR